MSSVLFNVAAAQGQGQGRHNLAETELRVLCSRVAGAAVPPPPLGALLLGVRCCACLPAPLCTHPPALPQPTRPFPPPRLQPR